MKHCPRCDADIGDSAVACRCGWKERAVKKQDEPAVFMQCAHMGCNTSAICRVKTPTGWADFCMMHYERFYEEKAHATSDRLGLFTVEQKRAWVREQMRTLAGKWRPNYNREPGEDLDEVAA